MEVLASCRYDWLISDKHGEKVRSHIVGLYIYIYTQGVVTACQHILCLNWLKEVSTEGCWIWRSCWMVWSGGWHYVCWLKMYAFSHFTCRCIRCSNDLNLGQTTCPSPCPDNQQVQCLDCAPLLMMYDQVNYGKRQTVVSVLRIRSCSVGFRLALFSSDSNTFFIWF